MNVIQIMLYSCIGYSVHFCSDERDFVQKEKELEELRKSCNRFEGVKKKVGYITKEATRRSTYSKRSRSLIMSVSSLNGTGIFATNFLLPCI